MAQSGDCVAMSIGSGRTALMPYAMDGFGGWRTDMWCGSKPTPARIAAFGLHWPDRGRPATLLGAGDLHMFRIMSKSLDTR